MKKLVCIILSVFSLQMLGQSGASSCNNPNLFCTGTTYTFPNTTGASSAPVGPNYGCLGSEPNPTFFYLQIANPGSLSISIMQSTTSGTGGLIDVDFICWGPLSYPSCGAIDTASVTGCSYSASATETCTINSALTGQFYMLMTTNFSNQSGFITLSQVGGTATTNCDSLPPPAANCYTGTPSAHICYVSADSVPNNVVYFNNTAYNFQGTIIYRQNYLSQWDSIGYVPSTHADYFTDITSNTDQQAYVYCTSQVDSCGNIRAKSPQHKTILLQSSLGTTGQINLSWNAYQGVTVPYYYIYRGATPTSMSLLTQVSSSTYAYTDLTPLSGDNYYKIAFPVSGCTSNASTDTVASSNFKVGSTTSSIAHVGNSLQTNIYPNPAKSLLYMQSPEIGVKIELVDLLGKLLITQTSSSTTENVNIQSLSSGTYFVKVTDSKGTYCRKFVVE